MNSQIQSGSGAMFDRIARRYDLLNRVMSLGMDRLWRRKLVSALSMDGERQFLDVATGTADVAMALATTYPQASVVGLDPSLGMLSVGHTKIDDANLDPRVTLIKGDAQKLPFNDGEFDACCISFGIRNVPDRALALAEMRRVTRPGGRVAILELGEPRSGLLAPIARFHIHTVVPRVGAWLSSTPEYQYLQDSIKAFPSPETFKALMESAGLINVSITPMGFDSTHLYVGHIPNDV
jgi:demethylmenaquinone methyltransferase/2-methoxy-6-polyprenyl-1,4-benzoquinol methylase